MMTEASQNSGDVRSRFQASLHWLSGTASTSTASIARSGVSSMGATKRS